MAVVANASSIFPIDFALIFDYRPIGMMHIIPSNLLHNSNILIF